MPKWPGTAVITIGKWHNNSNTILSLKLNDKFFMVPKTNWIRFTPFMLIINYFHIDLDKIVSPVCCIINWSNLNENSNWIKCRNGLDGNWAKLAAEINKAKPICYRSIKLSFVKKKYFQFI